MIDEIYNYRQSNMPTIEFSAEWSKLCMLMSAVNRMLSQFKQS